MAEFKISRQEIISLCRLCLAKDLASIDIFETGSETRQLFTKIVACLPVQIMTDDSLPKKICEVCNSKVDDFYQFWTSTAKNQKQLNDWLQIATTDSIKTDTTQIKVEADDTRQGEEYDDYDDGGRGDDEDDDDEDAPSAPKRIKIQDSGDEDFKPTNLVESAMEDTSDINGQQGGSNRKSKERQSVKSCGKFACQIRSPKYIKQFMKLSELQSYILKRNSAHMDNCNMCKKYFTLMEKAFAQLGDPKKISNNYYECYHCGSRYSKKIFISNHMILHKKKNFYECQFCRCFFSSRICFEKHFEKSVQKLNKNKPLDTGDLSLEEWTEIVSSKSKQCPVCKKTYCTPVSMRKHLREASFQNPTHL